MDSPNHNGMGERGGQEYYDPDYTHEISNKMRVPQRISVVDPDYAMKPIETIGEPHLQQSDKAMFMTVPDRILIGEGGRHVSGRDPLPEAKYERNVLDFHEPIQLETPPRTLTLDQHRFPSLDEHSNNHQKKVSYPQSEGSHSDDPEPGELKENGDRVKFDEAVNNLSSLEDFDDEKMNNSLVETPPGEVSRDDISSLKKQLRDTRRRLAVLEAENRERQQREVAFCSVALFYFILKGVMWMNRTW